MIMKSIAEEQLPSDLVKVDMLRERGTNIHAYVQEQLPDDLR